MNIKQLIDEVDRLEHRLKRRADDEIDLSAPRPFDPRLEGVMVKWPHPGVVDWLERLSDER